MCLIVGLPCGQFQGLSSTDGFCTIVSILVLFKAWPIMILDLHALIANIDLTFDGLGIEEIDTPLSCTN